MCCVFAGIFCRLYARQCTQGIYCPTFIPSYSIFISALPQFSGTNVETIFCYGENNSSSKSHFQRVIWKCSLETPQGHGGKYGPIKVSYIGRDICSIILFSVQQAEAKNKIYSTVTRIRMQARDNCTTKTTIWQLTQLYVHTLVINRTFAQRSLIHFPRMKCFLGQVIIRCTVQVEINGSRG